MQNQRRIFIAVLSGFVAYIVLLLVNFYAAKFWQSPPEIWVPWCDAADNVLDTLAWVIPAFIAGWISCRSGLAVGAVVGLLSALVSPFALSFLASNDTLIQDGLLPLIASLAVSGVINGAVAGAAGHLIHANSRSSNSSFTATAKDHCSYLTASRWNNSNVRHNESNMIDDSAKPANTKAEESSTNSVQWFQRRPIPIWVIFVLAVLQMFGILSAMIHSHYLDQINSGLVSPLQALIGFLYPMLFFFGSLFLFLLRKVAVIFFVAYFVWGVTKIWLSASPTTPNLELAVLAGICLYCLRLAAQGRLR